MAKKPERLEWFACYPGKLLGALQAMTPDQGLVYVVALLRIYEVRGPAADTIETLSRRTGLRPHRVKAALGWLVESGKITMQDDKLMNEVAEREIREGAAINRQRKLSAIKAANVRWRKNQQNQQTNHAPSNADAMPDDAHLHLHLQEQKERKKERSKSALEKRATKGSRIDLNWKPTAQQIEYAKSKGLNDREASREGVKFFNYWRATSGARGVKLDWDATWQNWVLSTAERLGREPAKTNGHRRDLTRDEWASVLRIYGTTNNWPGPGEPPGKPGCVVPVELLQAKLV